MKNRKMHWFLVEQLPKSLEENPFVITETKLLHQFNRVLKFKQGEQIVLFDGKGKSVECEIKDIDKKQCLLNILNIKEEDVTHKRNINLFFAIPKKNKFELIIEKGTEVGVTSFNPIQTDRTEKQSVNQERITKILTEAAEQSQSSIIPQIRKVQPFEEVIQSLDKEKLFVFHTEGEKLNANNLSNLNDVNIFIGPEGGWSDEELEFFKDKNIKTYKAGERILKTETACIVIPFLFNIS